MIENLIIFDNNHNKTEDNFKKLKKGDREILNEFKKYNLISAGEGRARKGMSNALRFVLMTGKDISEIDLKDLRDFLRILKHSDFSDYSKNDIKGFVQRFLKWNFKDWSERFNNFEDLKFNSDAQRKKKIGPKDVISLEEIGNLVKDEPSLIWKTFILVQYEGALRTLEARRLKWEDIDMEDPEAYWLNVKSKKNKNGTEKERIAFPLTQAIYFLDELKKSSKSPYVFPSLRTNNDYISSSAVTNWFGRLTTKVLGKGKVNYHLRHAGGERAHILVREGKLSKENAIMMMGHSEQMFDKTYSHADKEEMKKLIKKQVLNIEYLPPEKKHELEKRMEETERKYKIIAKKNDEMAKEMKIMGELLSKVEKRIKSK